MTNRLTPATLQQFSGTEQWYRHSLARHILYTDGVQYMAEHGGAYWLIDEIALAQHRTSNLARKPFQVWRLTVHADHSAMLTCDDGNEQLLRRKTIAYTDFPLAEITLYVTNQVILLPSEY